MRNIVDIFVALGERLRHFGTTAEDIALMERAMEQNPWFTAEDILHAIGAICDDMLERERLSMWLSSWMETADGPRQRDCRAPQDTWKVLLR